MTTFLCVPIMVLDEHTALADAAAARDAGADLIEFRVDELFTGSMDSHGQLDGREVGLVRRLLTSSRLDCIVTCRSAAEGGAYDGDESARVSLMESLGTASSAAGALGPKFIDFEYAAYLRSANIKQKINLAVEHPDQLRDVRTRLILSMHDFQGRPPDLLRRVLLMQGESAASVVKIVITARSIRDNLELFDLLGDVVGGGGAKPLIALAMGRFGLMSRVLAPKFGGYATFAPLRASSATAPGQPTLRELTEVYRFGSIGRSTRVYGVVGWPVEHSLGPVMHNSGFDALTSEADELSPGSSAGDAVYLPLPVPPEWEHFKATLGALIDHPRLDFGGCSVTLPHKTHLVRLAREARAQRDGIEWTIDEVSEVCGAGNTLVVERDPGGAPLRAHVRNTDAPAAAASLRSAIGAGRGGVGGLAGIRVGLIGAGGVARAVAAGLLAEGASVVVWNRTRAAADLLVSELNEARRGRIDAGELGAEDADAIGKRPMDALINCTPVGMDGGPAAAQSPVTESQLLGCASGGGRLVVFDTVYRPLCTPLLAMASRLGMSTVDGLGMFVLQAAEQFTAWTGRPAPQRLFDRVCREALAEGTP